MTDTILSRRQSFVGRRQTLAPGESTAWHTDPCQRFSVVLRGRRLAIEYADTGEVVRFPVSPGEADWDEPTDRTHRATNVGPDVYEEVTLFVLADPDGDPQPLGTPPSSSASAELRSESGDRSGELDR